VFNKKAKLIIRCAAEILLALYLQSDIIGVLKYKQTKAEILCRVRKHHWREAELKFQIEITFNQIGIILTDKKQHKHNGEGEELHSGCSNHLHTWHTS